MIKIGILGGSFDPPHNGHIKIAEEVCKRLALDNVLFIPSYLPPHRDKPQATEQQRLEMVRLAIQSLPFAEVSTIEIDRKGTSYTIDTLTELAAVMPKTELFLILGADAMELFPSWKQPTDILKLATVVIVNRPGYDFSNIQKFLATSPLEKSKNKVQFVECNSLDISSSELRTLIAQNKDVHSYIPEAVADYIEKRKLYR
jgi:nicotinate-nucleotide adenylyltransferase